MPESVPIIVIIIKDFMGFAPVNYQHTCALRGIWPRSKSHSQALKGPCAGGMSESICNMHFIGKGWELEKRVDSEESEGLERVVLMMDCENFLNRTGRSEDVAYNAYDDAGRKKAPAIVIVVGDTWTTNLTGGS